LQAHIIIRQPLWEQLVMQNMMTAVTDENNNIRQAENPEWKIND
jgi:hypothetical protein